MKPLVITLLVVALLFTGLFLLQADLFRGLDNVAEMVDLLEQQLSNGQPEEAKITADEIIIYWEKHHGLWEMFVDHGHLDQSEEAMYALQQLVGCEAEEAMWRENMAKFRFSTEHIREQNTLGFGALL